MTDALILRVARALWISSGHRPELWDEPPSRQWQEKMVERRQEYIDQAKAFVELMF